MKGAYNGMDILVVNYTCWLGFGKKDVRSFTGTLLMGTVPAGNSPLNVLIAPLRLGGISLDEFLKPGTTARLKISESKDFDKAFMALTDKDGNPDVWWSDEKIAFCLKNKLRFVEFRKGRIAVCYPYQAQSRDELLNQIDSLPRLMELSATS
jgi:hypothetical protein